MGKRAAAREPKRARAWREARVSPGFLFAVEKYSPQRAQRRLR
jgi:hypothetical protein